MWKILTSRNLHVRLKEHKRDIRIGNSNTALFLHISFSLYIYIYTFLYWLIAIKVILFANTPVSIPD